MIIIMKPGATAAEIGAVIRKAEAMGAKTHPIYGDNRTVVALVGDLTRVNRDVFDAMEGVLHSLRIQEPYKHTLLLLSVANHSRVEANALEDPAQTGVGPSDGSKGRINAFPQASSVAGSDEVVKAGLVRHVIRHIARDCGGLAALN